MSLRVFLNELEDSDVIDDNLYIFRNGKWEGLRFISKNKETCDCEFRLTKSVIGSITCTHCNDKSDSVKLYLNRLTLITNIGNINVRAAIPTCNRKRCTNKSKNIFCKVYQTDIEDARVDVYDVIIVNSESSISNNIIRFYYTNDKNNNWKGYLTNKNTSYANNEKKCYKCSCCDNLRVLMSTDVIEADSSQNTQINDSIGNSNILENIAEGCGKLKPGRKFVGIAGRFLYLIVSDVSVTDDIDELIKFDTSADIKENIIIYKFITICMEHSFNLLRYPMEKELDDAIKNKKLYGCEWCKVIVLNSTQCSSCGVHYCSDGCRNAHQYTHSKTCKC